LSFIYIQIERKQSMAMYEKKQVVFKSPDLSKMQAVVIDHKTTIYIENGSDPKKAKHRYFSRFEKKV